MPWGLRVAGCINTAVITASRDAYTVHSSVPRVRFHGRKVAHPSPRLPGFSRSPLVRRLKMSKTLSSFVQVVLLFAICSLAFTMAHAGATTYSDTLFCDYTTGCLGGFTLGFHPPSEPITTYGVGVSGFGFGFSGSSVGPFRQLLFVSASPFDFSASVTNFSEDVQCFDSQNCVYNWGGDFSGGTVTGSIHLLNFDYSTRSLDLLARSTAVGCRKLPLLWTARVVWCLSNDRGRFLWPVE